MMRLQRLNRQRIAKGMASPEGQVDQKSVIKHAIRSGFTLLEVLIVMAILIVLAGISVGFLLNTRDDAMDDAAMTSAMRLQSVCKLYKTRVGVFPSKVDDLLTRPAGVSATKWKRPFVEKLPTDPWGTPFQLIPGSGQSNIIHVRSAGADGIFDNEDDISTMQQ